MPRRAEYLRRKPYGHARELLKRRAVRRPAAEPPPIQPGEAEQKVVTVLVGIGVILAYLCRVIRQKSSAGTIPAKVRFPRNIFTVAVFPARYTYVRLAGGSPFRRGLYPRAVVCPAPKLALSISRLHGALAGGGVGVYAGLSACRRVKILRGCGTVGTEYTCNQRKPHRKGGHHQPQQQP